MIEDLKNVKDKVGYLLDMFPPTRDSDKLLWLAYMCCFSDLQKVIATGEYSEFKKMIMKKKTPTFESLTRVRRKYQEQGKFTGNLRREKLEESKQVRAWSRGDECLENLYIQAQVEENNYGYDD